MIIDIGCGRNKLDPAALGLDQSPDSAADVVCDLNRYPWPLRDNVASKIFLSHVVEHLDDLMPYEILCSIGKRVPRVYL